MKGAVDDLDLVLKTLDKIGYTEDRFYIHVDGALFGLMMPFVKKVGNTPDCLESDSSMSPGFHLGAVAVKVEHSFPIGCTLLIDQNIHR